MSDIFVSYAREDRDKARLLAEALAAQGWSVWWDRHIPLGKSFDRVIEEEIASASCVVVLWSRHSVDSDWVRSEAEEGRSRGILIPARLDEAPIPIVFRSMQAADLTRWNGDPNSELYREMLAAISQRVVNPAVTTPGQAEHPANLPPATATPQIGSSIRAARPLVASDGTVPDRRGATRNTNTMRPQVRRVQPGSARQIWISAVLAAGVVVLGIVAYGLTVAWPRAAVSPSVTTVSGTTALTDVATPTVVSRLPTATAVAIESTPTMVIGVPKPTTSTSASGRPAVNVVTFAPNGDMLASGGDNGWVSLWKFDAESMHEYMGVNLYVNDVDTNVRGRVNGVAFAPDGKSIAAGTDSAAWRKHIDDIAIDRRNQDSKDSVYSVAFAPPNGEFIAFAGYGEHESKVRLWRLADDTVLQMLDVAGTVNSMAFSPDGQTLASAGEDGLIRLWRTRDRAQLRLPLAGHRDRVLSVAFSPDGRTLASAGQDGTVRLWQFADGREQRALGNSDHAMTSVAFAPDGQKLAAGDDDGTIWLWELSNWDSPLKIDTSIPVSSVAFAQNKQLGLILAAGGKDGRVRMWRVSDQKLLHTCVHSGRCVQP